MVTQNQKAGMALARGFIVFIMPAVHSVWLYSAEPVKNGWLGQTLGFLAEGPGAQLFMFLMGVFIVLGRRKTINQILRRSLIIFLAGYLLNFLKLVVPYYAGWMPEAFLVDNGFKTGASEALQLLLVGDILQFAAIAYLFCGLLTKTKYRILWIMISILGILIITPCVWSLTTENILTNTLLNLFNAAPPHTFFPVLPWLFYPLLGLLGGVLIQQADEKKINPIFFVTGILMIIIGKAIVSTEPVQWQQTFYRLGRGGTLMHGGIVLVWVSLFLWLAKSIPRNYFFQLLQWLSRNITIIYLLQWIVIMWMLPVFGYNRLNLPVSIGALLITSLISFLIPFFVQQYFQKNKNKFL